MQFMSIPLEQDFSSDEFSAFAPKRVREAARAEWRGLASKSLRGIDIERPTATPTSSDRPLAIDGHDPRRSLEPTLMPDALGSPTGFSLAVLVRVAVATLVVAIVTLLVLGKIPTPWTVSTTGPQESAPSFRSISEQHARTAEQPETPVPQLNLSQQDPRPPGQAIPLGASLTGAAEGANIVIDGLAHGSTVTVGQSLGNTWRIPLSDLNRALVQPPRGYAGSMDVLVELRLTDNTLVDRKPLRLEWTAVTPSQINAVTQPPADLKNMFNQFVENYTASIGKRTFSTHEREILFAKFQQYLDSQISTRSAR
jgi:hypothetical protein